MKPQYLALLAISWLLSACSGGSDSTTVAAGTGTTTTTTSTTTSSTTTTTLPAGCPTNYTLIPANATLGTAAFCVSQYEMKASTNAGSPVMDTYTSTLDVTAHKPDSRPDGLPWVRINHNQAIAECASLGTGYHLITMAQWSALARNVESVASNWSGGSVGSGTLFRGHTDDTMSGSAITDGYSVTGTKLLSAGNGTDPYVGTGNSSSDSWGSGKEQKRTMLLSNGDVIWDLGGNARERVDFDGNGSTISYTGPGASSLNEVLSATTSSMVSSIVISGGGSANLNWFTPATSGLTDGANYIGQYYISSNARTGRTVTRGGNFTPGNSPGIFAGDFDSDATSTSSSAGFRCTRTP